MSKDIFNVKRKVYRFTAKNIKLKKHTTISHYWHHEHVFLKHHHTCACNLHFVLHVHVTCTLSTFVISVIFSNLQGTIIAHFNKYCKQIYIEKVQEKEEQVIN